MSIETDLLEFLSTMKPTDTIILQEYDIHLLYTIQSFLKSKKMWASFYENKCTIFGA